MKNLLLLIILSALFTASYSQSTLLWTEDFTVGNRNYFSTSPQIKASTNTFSVDGMQHTADGDRLLIVKYDLNGDTISSHIFGNDSMPYHMVDYKFDDQNNVYLLMRKYLEQHKSKIFIQKYSLSGNLIWIEQIHEIADTSYAPHSLGIINDSTLFVTGYQEYNYPTMANPNNVTITVAQLYAYSTNGNQLWKRAFDPISEIEYFAYGIFIHNNTAFLFANVNTLVTVDYNNNIVVSTRPAVSGGINAIQLTPDNKLLLTGQLFYNIYKLNLNGTLVWHENYGTNLPSNVTGDVINAMFQDGAGNIYVSGQHYGDEYGTSNYSNADILTIKYDNMGTLVWENRFEFGIDNADIGNCITLKNGNLYVGGQSQRMGVGTDYDYLVLKMDTVIGMTTGNYRYNGITNGDDVVTSLHALDNDSLLLTGLSGITNNFNWTTQLLSNVILSASSVKPNKSVEVFPNPIQNGEVLSIDGIGGVEYSITSTTGQIIQQGKLEADELNTLQILGMATGVYILQVKTDYQTLSSKIIVR